MRAAMALALLFLLCGCSDDETGPVEDDGEYQISVDYIEVPASIASTDSLVVRLYGTIGRNGCYRFDHMDTVARDSVFEMTAFGVYEGSPTGLCPMVVVQWEGREFVKAPPQEGQVVRVVFHQPDGTEVVETVPVDR